MSHKKKEKKILDRYIIRKYIYASSALEAIKKDKVQPVQEVFIDQDWEKQTKVELVSAMGFQQPEENE